jgi:hypothetical protein
MACATGVFAVAVPDQIPHSCGGGPEDPVDRREHARESEVGGRSTLSGTGLQDFYQHDGQPLRVTDPHLIQPAQLPARRTHDVRSLSRQLRRGRGQIPDLEPIAISGLAGVLPLPESSSRP